MPYPNIHCTITKTHLPGNCNRFVSPFFKGKEIRKPFLGMYPPHDLEPEWLQTPASFTFIFSWITEAGLHHALSTLPMMVQQQLGTDLPSYQQWCKETWNLGHFIDWDLQKILSQGKFISTTKKNTPFAPCWQRDNANESPAKNIRQSTQTEACAGIVAYSKGFFNGNKKRNQHTYLPDWIFEN